MAGLALLEAPEASTTEEMQSPVATPTETSAPPATKSRTKTKTRMRRQSTKPPPSPAAAMMSPVTTTPAAPTKRTSPARRRRWTPPKKGFTPPVPTESTLSTVETPATSEMPARTMTQAEGFAEVVRRANAGSATCLAGLKKILDDNPAIWERAGDVAAIAEHAWIERVSAENVLAAESVKRSLRALKVSLAGQHPSALESVVVDWIGVAHLALHQAERDAAESGGSVQQAALRFRRAESAGRRFSSAVRTLTLIRALIPKTVPATVEHSEPAQQVTGLGPERPD